MKLAACVAAILLVIGMPVAYWLAYTNWRGKFLLESLVALPLVLPPTVLGFYALVAMARAAAGKTVDRPLRPRTGVHVRRTDSGVSAVQFSVAVSRWSLP